MLRWTVECLAFLIQYIRRFTSQPLAGRRYTMREIPVAEILDANQVLAALIAFKKGDFSVRLPVNQVGLAGKIADVLNDIFELNENMATELSRVSTAVGKEGRIGQRASLNAASGSWASCVAS